MTRPRERGAKRVREAKRQPKPRKSSVRGVRKMKTHSNLALRINGILTLATAVGWNTGNDLDAGLTGTLAPAASRFFWIRVLVN